MIIYDHFREYLKNVNFTQIFRFFPTPFIYEYIENHLTSRTLSLDQSCCSGCTTYSHSPSSLDNFDYVPPGPLHCIKSSTLCCSGSKVRSADVHLLGVCIFCADWLVGFQPWLSLSPKNPHRGQCIVCDSSLFVWTHNVHPLPYLMNFWCLQPHRLHHRWLGAPGDSADFIITFLFLSLDCFEFVSHLHPRFLFVDSSLTDLRKRGLVLRATTIAESVSVFIFMDLFEAWFVIFSIWTLLDIF